MIYDFFCCNHQKRAEQWSCQSPGANSRLIHLNVTIRLRMVIRKITAELA